MGEETGYFGVCPLQGGETRLQTCGESYIERLALRPVPCVRDQLGKVRTQSLKQLFLKIYEELIELETAVCIKDYLDFSAEEADLLFSKLQREHIASEAADLITAVTTLEEAIGIPSAMRDKALQTVYQSNKRKGRL